MSEESAPLQGKRMRLDINQVVPYWRNPRRLSNEAVEAVKQSIEQYGYSQPIVVDKDYTIIIGHTRYAALRRMDQTHIDVTVAEHLSPIKVKQLRVIDNRSGEYAFWDFDKLQEEVANTDSELLTELFPEILSQMDNGEQGSGPTVEWGPGAGGEEQEDYFKNVDYNTPFVCPSCFHEWETVVTKDQIMSGTIVSKKGVSA